MDVSEYIKNSGILMYAGWRTMLWRTMLLTNSKSDAIVYTDHAESSNQFVSGAGRLCPTCLNRDSPCIGINSPSRPALPKLY
jgi:hypothetical protein